MRKRLKVKKGMRVRKTQCATCVFSENQANLTEARVTEIKDYLLGGLNQFCHSDGDKTVCRGGRDFQLQCWSRMGLISAPTDKALREAMVKANVESGSHI